MDFQELQEYEYYTGKVPGRTYVSKRIESKNPEIINGEVVEKIIPIRYASKVLDLENSFGFMKEKGEVKLRVTPDGRQEIQLNF